MKQLPKVTNVINLRGQCLVFILPSLSAAFNTAISILENIFLFQTVKVKVKSLSHVRLFATQWTAAYQAPPSMGFSRPEYWSRLPCPSLMRESEVAQSCPTLSNPMDCSPPGSSIHGIFQARVLEWGAIALSVVK